MEDEIEKFDFALELVNNNLTGLLVSKIKRFDRDIYLHTTEPGELSSRMLPRIIESKRIAMKKLDEINVCCNEEEKRMLIELGLELHERYPRFPLKKIFIVLIFSYYGHNLLEQTGDELYSDQFIIKDKQGNYKDPELKRIFDTIYFKIGASDEPIFKKIRRAFLGFKGGRNKNRRHKRTKRGRSNKNKTIRYKRRHTRKY